MASDQQTGTEGSVVLRDRYLLFPAAPLPEYSTPSAQAFRAEDKRDQRKALFVLIARPGFPTRIDSMRALKGSEAEGLMTLVEWGTVDWPSAKRKVVAAIYERPAGGRVMASMTSEFKRVEENELIRKVITPAFQALRILRSHSVTHRAIRPTNMFWATVERDRVLLGDSTTALPAVEQPVLIEPIESAMCHAAGRGPGTSADDIYSLGASIALLLLGHNPAAGLDDDTILRRKIVQGSFAVLVGEERLPLQLSEILRGMLCDDPHERWQADSIELWLSGRRLSPLLAKFEKRAARTFSFNGKEYWTARELSAAFSRNWDAVATVVLDGRLELWLRRSLDQKDKADAVASITRDAVMAINDKRGAAFDTLVAKTCMLLDPRAPIRYKTLSVMPEGIGGLLAYRMAEGGDVRLIAEAIMREVPKAYFQTREAYNPENSMMEAVFRDLKGFLDRGSIGYGIERVLYAANESMPCISPFTIHDHVVDIRDLLPALESAAKTAGGKAWPIDRHVAAFISARSTFDVERQISELSLPDPQRTTMAMLNLLAVIQWRLGQGGLQALTTWVASLAMPAIGSFHSRSKRRAIEKDVPRVAKEGSLVELSRLLDNPENRAIDNQGFYDAQNEWFARQREIEEIATGQNNHNEKALHFAQQLAALLSLTISLVTVVLLLISRVM